MSAPSERATPGAATPGERGQFVQSLARGLSVIGAFDAAHPVMSLSEVARRTELTRATARRFLLTLESLGYVRTDGKNFELTPKVLGLGYAYLSSLSLPQLAQPHLERLSREVGESTSMSVLDGKDIVYVARVATRSIMTVAISVGTRFPAYATSMGRVLLAHLPDDELSRYVHEGGFTALTGRTTTRPDELAAQLRRVREEGYALVDQELEAGLRSAAVAVRDPRGTAVAAINVSMRAGVGTAASEPPGQRVVPGLFEAAHAIEADLAAAGG